MAFDFLHLISGEEVALVHLDAAELAHLVISAGKAGLQLLGGAEDKEAGVPHCLLYLNLPLQVMEN